MSPKSERHRNTAHDHSAATLAVEERRLQPFVSRLRGQVLRPGDDGYDAARRVWNGRFDRRPGLIVRCAGVADVISAVEFARANDLLVAVRGGGHSVAGHGVCDGGMVIDLSGMRDVRVDPAGRTARVEGGAVWRDVDHETAALGLAVTGGQISSTGVGGLTLGGGVGWLMRAQGLTIDNLLSVDLVTAEGRFLVASHEEHPDLFWGLGGGGGNFGVATACEFRLHPVSTILGGVAIHPIERAREALAFYQDYTANSPDELTVMALILAGPRQPFVPRELHGRPIFAFGVCYAGPLEEGERVLRPLRAFGPPLVDLVRPMPYTTLQGMFDQGSLPGVMNAWKSWYLRALDERAIETIVDHASRVTSPLSQVLLTGMGGAVARVAPGATAFNHREGAHCLEILAKWTHPDEAAPHVTWARTFWEAMRPFTTGGVYVNFLDDEGPQALKLAYSAGTYERLVALKDRYDPTNFFRVNHNIAPRGG